MNKDMKRIVFIIVSILILLAIPLTVLLVSRNQELRKRAAPATTLTLTPTTLTKQVGDEFTLDVHMDTATNQVVAVQVSLAFDPTKLEAEWIHNGTMLPNIISSGVVGNGTAAIALGAANTTTPITGTGLVATIKLKALAKTDSPITVKFAADSFVGALGEGSTNVLTSTIPSTITISGGTTVDTTNTNTSASSSASLAPSLNSNLSATDSAATASAISILTPTKNESVATQNPTIEGKAPPGSTVTIAIHSTQQITATVTADANGNWSYTVPQTLDAGPHTIVVATQDPTTGKTSSATLAFVVANDSSNGASGSAMPVSGSVEPTLILIGLGTLLFLGGLTIPIVIKTNI